MAFVLSHLAATFAVALGGLCAFCLAAWLRGFRPRLPAWLWRERSPWERAVLAAMLCAAVHVGATKESGGTNNVPQMLPPGGGAGMCNYGNVQLCNSGIAHCGGGVQFPLANPAFAQFHNCTISQQPSNAVLCADWLAFGGFEDWTCDCAIVKMWKCAITELPIVVESGNSHWMIPLLHNGIIAQSPIVGRRAIRVGISHGAGNC